jgi:adenine-specific DNA-methyltransferase
MQALKEIETHRLALQQNLDEQKDAVERNKLGQFATPSALALHIAKYVKKNCWRRSRTVKFLDPSVGSGAFYSATLQAFGPKAISKAVGVEIDTRFANAAESLWGSAGLEVISDDFTKFADQPRLSNLVLANPPYVRHHHLATAEKLRLQQCVMEQLNIKVSGLAGLYCYFLLLTHQWMEPDATAVWLIPSEFMDVNYGSAVKEYLLRHVTLLRIHRFNPRDVQFDDALVSSAIVVFRNNAPCDDHSATFSFGGSIEAPDLQKDVTLNELANVAKWTSLPRSIEKDQTPSAFTIGDLFDVKRGLATGSNSFFIFPEEQARQLQIPDEFFKYVLPSPRHLKERIVERDAKGAPKLANKLVMLDCKEALDSLKKHHKKLWQYLTSDEALEVQKGYLASRRVPWYSQENRETPPFVCTYMGRGAKGGTPFRFIWNRSNAVATNVYLLLYPKGAFRAALNKNPELLEPVFTALSRICSDDFTSEGRVYGGGLHKMEPNELKNVRANDVAAAAGMATPSVQRELDF